MTVTTNNATSRPGAEMNNSRQPADLSTRCTDGQVLRHLDFDQLKTMRNPVFDRLDPNKPVPQQGPNGV